MIHRIVLGCALLVLGESAAAHTGTGLAGGFAPGFAHPCTGFDHLLAMIAVGLWGAFLGPPLLQLLPVIFPGMMVGGALLAMFGVPVPPVEIGIAISVLVLGICIAMRFESPVWLATAIVACFGIFHGYAHGKELPSAADPIGYSAGFVLATGLLHVTGIGLGFLADRPGGATLIRAVGSSIGALGVWFSYAALMS